MSDYRSAGYEKTDTIPEREKRLKRFAVAHPRLLVHRDSFIHGELFIIPTCSEYFRISNGLSLQRYFALKHSVPECLKERLKVRLERLLLMRRLVVAHLCFSYLSFRFQITLTIYLITAIASNLRTAKSKQITISKYARQSYTAQSCNYQNFFINLYVICIVFLFYIQIYHVVSNTICIGIEISIMLGNAEPLVNHKFKSPP